MKKNLAIKYTRKRHMNRKKVFIFPDVHFPFQDDDSLAIALNFCIDMNPDIILFLGDLLDYYKGSTFSHDPTRKDIKTMYEESLQGKAFLTKVRGMFPDARIIFKEGNHEERFFKKLINKAPEYADIPFLNTEYLLGCKELGIEYYDVHTLCMLGDTVISHGHLVRNKSGYTAMGELLHWNMNGISGHTHRMGQVSLTTLPGTITWTECGCLCKVDPCYARGKVMNWQPGFAIADFYPDTGKMRPTPIPIQDKEAHYNRRIYTPEGVILP